MNKKAFLFGNTHGLPGVKIDISNFSSFLKSDYGGAWLDHEVDIKYDISKRELLELIITYTKRNLDYLIIVFSGHGGQMRETNLELNASGETIEETLLRKIANRQLNIYDCCRCYPTSAQDSLLLKELSVRKASDHKIRDRYDKRIMEAIHQQVLLYSCAISQKSYDTKDGGLYIQSLLKSSKNITSDYKLVGEAHQEAKVLTEIRCKKEFGETQNPEAVLPKCLSSQQLILSIRP